MKKLLSVLIILFSTLQAQAFEDCVISTDGKLTDISIENNKIIDVYPLVTIMNEKNTLIIHPLMSGKTRFCVLKNKKDKIIFNVEVSEDKTTVDDVDGFDILEIDVPPYAKDIYEYELDLPPEISVDLQNSEGN